MLMFRYSTWSTKEARRAQTSPSNLLKFFKNNEGSVCYSLASQCFVDLRDYLSHVCQCVPLSWKATEMRDEQRLFVLVGFIRSCLTTHTTHSPTCVCDFIYYTVGVVCSCVRVSIHCAFQCLHVVAHVRELEGEMMIMMMMINVDLWRDVNCSLSRLIKLGKAQ